MMIIKRPLESVVIIDRQGDMGVFDTMNDAIESAHIAQKEYSKYNLSKREEIIESFKNELRNHIEELSMMTYKETGMGRYEDKILKNKLALDKTPGVEDLNIIDSEGNNNGSFYELAPFGVIGAIAPSTNPTETIINNSISMLASGNTVVFSPHPGAKKVSAYTVQLINSAIIKAGGPKNLVVTIKEPNTNNTNIMLKHEKVIMICATGGQNIVKIALSSGKKTIGAGAGNPPVIVDETADIEKAAKDIIDGCSFDNNLPCIAEKEIIVINKVANDLKKHMSKNLALEIKDKEILKRLERLLITKNGTLNKKYVGKNADYIMNSVGVKIDSNIKVIFAEVDKNHPFAQKELMMPILPLIRVLNIDEAIKVAVELEHGNKHTAIMHSRSSENLNKFTQAIDTTIFVKNAPSYAGIGYGTKCTSTFTIAGPTGEGLTTAKTFARKKKCVYVDSIAN